MKAVKGKKTGNKKTVKPKSGSDDRVRTLRRLLLYIGVIAVVIVACFGIAVAFRTSFKVNTIVFAGNEHLTDEELREVAGLKGGENLLTLSAERIYDKMNASPWIRSAAVRKDLPDTLTIRISESEPFALLDMKGKLFIVDDKGKMLEELKDNAMPFLPVIASNPYSEKEVFIEAIALAKAIRESGLNTKKDHIEIIAHKVQEMSVNLDGMLVKVGKGEYREKLSRLIELEEEIRNRRIPVDYIDLRFENRLIVKPVTEVRK